MLWLYYNSRGQLLESINTGGNARAGTTDFQIFAFFDSVNLSVYGEASLKLRKPDYQETEYASLLMTLTNVQFPGTTSSSYFVAGQSYRGFLFDFASYNNTEDIAILLDTPGLWKAVISLYSTGGVISVQGIATFLVENGIYNPDGTELNLDDVLPAVYAALAGKISNINGIVVINGLPSSSELEAFESGQIFYNRNDNEFYVWNGDVLSNFDFFGLSFKLAKTSTLSAQTLSGLFSDIGNSFAIIEHDGKFYLGNIKQASSSTFNFYFLSADSNSPENRYVGSSVSGTTSLTNVFGSTYSKPFATEDWTKINFVPNIGFLEGTLTIGNLYNMVSSQNGYFKYFVCSTFNGNVPYFGRIEPVSGGNYSLVFWNTNGYVAGTSNTPTDTLNSFFNYATTRTYATTIDLATKVDKVTTSGVGLYGHSGATQTTYPLSSQAIGNHVPLRDTNGQLKVPVTPTNNDDATSKQFVENSISSALTSFISYQGSLTVAQINALNTSTLKIGYFYNVTDSGTLTVGNLPVLAGDNVVWTGSGWDKLTMDLSVYDDKFIAAGFFVVENYDEDTGEMTIAYSSDLYVMDYTGSTGILEIEAI